MRVYSGSKGFKYDLGIRVTPARAIKLLKAGKVGGIQLDGDGGAVRQIIVEAVKRREIVGPVLWADAPIFEAAIAVEKLDWKLMQLFYKVWEDFYFSGHWFRARPNRVVHVVRDADSKTALCSRPIAFATDEPRAGALICRRCRARVEALP